jgi:hypothetical protein
VPDRDVEAPPQASGRRRAGFYVGAVVTGLFLVRLLGASWSSHFPAVWPDATFAKEGYLAVAAKSPFRPSFYNAFRPIGYPFLLWTLGRNTQLTVVAQAALYCAGAGALIATALRVMQSRAVGVICAALLAGVAVQAKFALWTTQILSESLAISLGFCALAAWWRFAVEPTRARARWGILFLILWLVVRDAHVLPTTVVFVPVILLVAWLGKHLGDGIRRTLAIGAALVLLTAVYSYFAQSSSHRATLSFHNVVGVRILPDKQLTNWFVHHGMPLDQALRTRTGKSGLDDDFYKSTDPAFAQYRHWARGAGPRALAESLVFKGPHYVSLLYDDLPSVLRADVQYYDTQGVYNRLPREMPLQLGGPTTRRGLTVWLVLAAAALAAALALALQRRRGAGIVVFGATALVLTLLELYTTWVGDPLEVQRHLVGTLSRLSMILVVIVASAADVGIDARRARPPVEDEPPQGPAPEPRLPWEEKYEAEYGSKVAHGA